MKKKIYMYLINMEEEDSENIYERLIDILINNQPLTTSRIHEFSDAIRINV